MGVTSKLKGLKSQCNHLSSVFQSDLSTISLFSFLAFVGLITPYLSIFGNAYEIVVTQYLCLPINLVSLDNLRKRCKRVRFVDFSMHLEVSECRGSFCDHNMEIGR
jgi:uncharacterized membrane protein